MWESHFLSAECISRSSEGRGGEGAARGPFDPGKFRALVPGGKVWNYLTQTRKLDGGKLVEYSVGETADGAAYSFAYKWWPPGIPRKEGAKPRFEFVKVVEVERVDGRRWSGASRGAAETYFWHVGCTRKRYRTCDRRGRA